MPGYLYWMDALAIPAAENVYAYDLSVSDWLAEEAYPVFLLRNPFENEVQASFVPAPIWQKKQPSLFADESLLCDVWDLQIGEKLQSNTNKINLTLAPQDVRMIAALPCGVVPTRKDNMLMANNIELCAIDT